MIEIGLLSKVYPPEAPPSPEANNYFQSIHLVEQLRLKEHQHPVITEIKLGTDGNLGHTETTSLYIRLVTA